MADRLGQQDSQSAGEQSRLRGVGAARQNHRHASAHDQSGHLCARHERQFFVHHVAGFDIGRDEDVGLPGDRRFHALDPRRLLVHRNVEIQRTIDDAADDLPAIRHLGERGRINGRGHLRIHRLDGCEDRNLGLRDSQRPCQDDRVLDDVTLLIQIGSDIYCGVADDDATGIGRRCEDKAVAQKAVRSQAVLALNDSMHILICMQAAFHQRPHLAAAGQTGSDSR